MVFHNPMLKKLFHHLIDNKIELKFFYYLNKLFKLFKHLKKTLKNDLAQAIVSLIH
jgi:hypothetical protein